MVVATDHQRNCRTCQVFAGKLPAQPGTVNLYSVDFLCTAEYNTERVALSVWAGDDGQLLKHRHNTHHGDKRLHRVYREAGRND
jgi:hypothetical protein